MSSKGYTKEEHFIVFLYKKASLQENIYEFFDSCDLGNALHLSPRLLKNIIQTLTQANFIKKSGKRDISLTPHGKELAEKLLF